MSKFREYLEQVNVKNEEHYVKILFDFAKKFKRDGYKCWKPKIDEHGGGIFQVVGKKDRLHFALFTSKDGIWGSGQTRDSPNDIYLGDFPENYKEVKKKIDSITKKYLDSKDPGDIL